MNWFGKRSAPTVDPVELSTHVLQWIPAWLIDGAGEGSWELQTRDNFDQGTPDASYDVPDIPFDAALEDLAGWVAGQLGHEVMLTHGQQFLRALGDGEWCPMYWVTPTHLLPD